MAISTTSVDPGALVARSSPSSAARVRRIIGAYDSLLVRLYCLVRFRIVRTRFLQELVQYLPRQGRVAELGCGFGLFGLYFAMERPGLDIVGFDIDESRIALASRARKRLGVENIRFSVGDACESPLTGQLDAAYLLDVVHHIPPDSARALLADVHGRLVPGGVVLIKDVDVRPRWKMWFTWLLDVIMTGGERPDYWSADDMAAMLDATGFEVFRHSLVDSLPYPHVLYVARKRGGAHLALDVAP